MVGVGEAGRCVLVGGRIRVESGGVVRQEVRACVGRLQAATPVVVACCAACHAMPSAQSAKNCHRSVKSAWVGRSAMKRRRHMSNRENRHAMYQTLATEGRGGL